jgi:hypothetical protein
MREKFCEGCGEVKPFDEFYDRKGTVDRKTFKCKSCFVVGVKGNQKNKKCYVCKKPNRTALPTEIEGKWEYVCLGCRGVKDGDEYVRELERLVKEKEKEWVSEQFYR